MNSEVTTLSLNTALLIALFSGFIGALLPLVMQPYFNHRNKLYERMKRHVDSLVKLELRLLDIDAALHDNKLIFKTIIDGYANNEASIVRLVKLELEDSFFSDSFSGELNNKLYQLRYDLKRINSDIENFNYHYDILIKGILTGEISDERIKTQMDNLLEEKDVLQDGFNKLKEKCLKLRAYVVLRMKKDKVPLMIYRSWIIQKRLQKITDEDIKQEMNQYEREIKNL